MKKIFKKEVVIGLSALLALAILFFGINWLKGVNIFKPSNSYYVSYANIQGLVVNNDVMSNGFKVGQVREIDYDYEHPGMIRVEISLDKRMRLPEGTKAVLTPGLIGSPSIVLQLGSGPATLHPGDALEAVSEPSMLQSAASTLKPAAESILPKIDTLLTNINRITGDSALLSSVQRLDQITADLQRTTSNLAAITAQVQPTVRNLNEVSGNAVTISDNLAQFSGTLNEMPVDSIVANLEETTANLRLLSAELNNPNSSLGMLMNDPALYNNLNGAVLSMDSLLQDIKANPKRYIHIKVF